MNDDTVRVAVVCVQNPGRNHRAHGVPEREAVPRVQ